jgi:MipA family protein
MSAAKGDEAVSVHRARRRRAAWAAAAAVLAITAGPAAAEDWVVTVGGAAQATVPYEGAGRNLFIPVPSIALRRPGRPARPTFADDTPSLSVLSTGWLSIGPDVQLRGKRNSDGPRAGLNEVPLAIEPGLFITWWPADWLRLHATERRGIRGDHGWTGDAGLDFVVNAGRWTATIGPRIGWGDRNYMETYFGVTPGEAAASPIIDTAYSPSGGLRYAGGYGGLGYRFGHHWQTWANVSVHQLASGPADSPIVRQIGSRTDVAGGIGVKYTFDWRR